jgi:hypothetical protein
MTPIFNSTIDSYNWAISNGRLESEFRNTWDVTEDYIDLGNGQLLIESYVIELDPEE